MSGFFPHDLGHHVLADLTDPDVHDLHFPISNWTVPSVSLGPQGREHQASFTNLELTSRSRQAEADTHHNHELFWRRLWCLCLELATRTAEA
jgi:hypothetical protein